MTEKFGQGWQKSKHGPALDYSTNKQCMILVILALERIMDELIYSLVTFLLGNGSITTLKMHLFQAFLVVFTAFHIV